MADNRTVPRQPTILIILDGFGVNPSRINNAVQEANTPRLDEYFSRNTHTRHSMHAVQLLAYLKVKWEILKLAI